MRALLASGHLVDVALAVIVVEAAALVQAWRRGASRLRPLDVVGQLLAGAMLLLAVRCALTGADSRWTLAFLTASLPAHAFDIARRARSSNK